MMKVPMAKMKIQGEAGLGEEMAGSVLDFDTCTSLHTLRSAVTRIVSC